MEFITKCPYCQIGFGIMCIGPDKPVHMDIMWTSEAGLVQDCLDPEVIIPYVIKNSKYGTGYSLSEELIDMFETLNQDFHSDPSKFSKLNVPIENFMVLMGEFFRYADYMNNRKIKEGVDGGCSKFSI
jgi:hypothetical protein